MLPEVETPLLSPRGIPYMFRFTVREDQGKTVGDDRQMMRWVAKRIEIPQPYLGLKARYSQVFMNPATLACLCLIVIATVFKIFVGAMLDASSAYLYLSCSASSLTSSQFGTYYQLSEGVMQMFNQTYAQQIEQYEYTVNATLWNLQSSANQYAGLLACYYQTLYSGLPHAALEGSQNVTDVLGKWAETQLQDANNYTTNLLRAIHDAMGELGGGSSGGATTSNVTTIVPTGVNMNLNVPNNVFYNITSNAQVQLDLLFTNASTFVAQAFEKYSLPSNISFVSAEYEPNSCSNIMGQYSRYSKLLDKQYKVQVSIFAFAAFVLVVVAGLYTSYKWRQARILGNQIENSDSPLRGIEVLEDYRLLYGLVHRLVDNRKWFTRATANNIRWFVSFVCSTSFLSVLCAGWCFVILSICVGSLRASVLDGGLQVIDLSSNLPSNAYVNATSNSTAMSISTGDLNKQIQDLETNINNQITWSLTDLVTSVNSIMNTINQTMSDSSNEVLEANNLTINNIGLNFSLIYEQGFAVQQVTLTRLPSTLAVNTSSANPSFVLGGDYVYGISNITATCASAEKTLRALGVSLISSWIASVVVSTSYILLVCYLN